MHVNGKMRPVETISGMGGGGKRRMMEEVIYLIYKCHNAPPAQ
jgi:hypothetical protein